MKARKGNGMLAKGLGTDLESVEIWLKRTYNVPGNNLCECIQNNHNYKEVNAPKILQHRYILRIFPTD